jgi:hypothetical protein
MPDLTQPGDECNTARRARGGPFQPLLFLQVAAVLPPLPTCCCVCLLCGTLLSASSQGMLLIIRLFHTRLQLPCVCQQAPHGLQEEARAAGNAEVELLCTGAQNYSKPGNSNSTCPFCPRPSKKKHFTSKKQRPMLPKACLLWGHSHCIPAPAPALSSPTTPMINRVAAPRQGGALHLTSKAPPPQKKTGAASA